MVANQSRYYLTVELSKHQTGGCIYRANIAEPKYRNESSALSF